MLCSCPHKVRKGHALDVHPCYDSKLCKGDADRTEEERRAHKQKHILRVCDRAGSGTVLHRLTGLNLYLVRQLLFKRV